MNFKTALFISFLSHCFILTPIGNLWFFPQHKRVENPPITYYKLAPPKVEAEKRVPEKPKLQKSDIVKKVKSAVRRQAPKVPVFSPTPPEAAPQKKVLPPKENLIPSSIPGTTLPNTPACIEYNQYIREQIQRSLRQRYTPEYEEGDVNVSFALEQSGGLISLDIIEEKSSSDKELRRLAYEGIRAASPFRPFPNGLLQKQISFNLTVVFKKD